MTISTLNVFDQRPDLLRGFKEGKREALSAVYWAYAAEVERVIRRGFVVASSGAEIWGLGRRAEARDLVQDVFVRAFSDEARKSYDGGRHYWPYLSTIARHRLVDWARQQGRLVTFEQAELEALLGEHAAHPDPPIWSDPETVGVAERYLATLTPELRGVYTERYVHARSQMDAAAVLGISRQQLRRLEGLLRTGLSREIARARSRLGGETRGLVSASNAAPPGANGDGNE